MIETESKYTSVRLMLANLNKNILSLNEIIDNKKNFNKDKVKVTSSSINSIFVKIDEQTLKIKSELEEDSSFTIEEMERLNNDFIDYCQKIDEKSQIILEKIGDRTDSASISTNSFNENSVGSQLQTVTKANYNIYENEETSKLVSSLNIKLGKVSNSLNIANKNLYQQSFGISNTLNNYESAEKAIDRTNRMLKNFTTIEYIYTYSLHLLVILLFIIIGYILYNKIFGGWIYLLFN